MNSSADESSIGHQLQSKIAAYGLTAPVIAPQTIAVFFQALEGTTTHNSPHFLHLNELWKTPANTTPSIGSVGFLHLSHCLAIANSRIGKVRRNPDRASNSLSLPPCEPTAHYAPHFPPAPNSTPVRAQPPALRPACSAPPALSASRSATIRSSDAGPDHG